MAERAAIRLVVMAVIVLLSASIFSTAPATARLLRNCSGPGTEAWQGCCAGQEGKTFWQRFFAGPCTLARGDIGGRDRALGASAISPPTHERGGSTGGVVNQPQPSEP
ncbi:hypothetical protein GCM10007874_53020 [Labrys miyagiensis]|uniref:Uncharacterized protein n=1 Tax=Labrys miyagiensis TaxID=346912 RepID=A0ABQ6CQ53_9HYPH|nr:hypothetical protein GCM10007874_53020 [Labrys miyagiensis]